MRVGKRSVAASAEVTGFVKALAGRVEENHIGVLEQPPEQVIGTIQDLGMTPAEYFVLDGRLNDVKVFDNLGNYEQTFGGAGGGPGEFAVPRSLAFASPDTVYVADEARKIHRFVRADGKWIFDRAIATAFFVHDLCVLRGDLIVLGVSAGQADAIHRLTMDGEQLGSFGVPYRTDNFDIRKQVSDGQLVCADEENAVFVAFNLIPEVHKYSSDGAVLWISRIQDYEPILMLEPLDGFPIMGLDPERKAMSTLLRFVRAEDGPLVLQIALQDPESIRNEAMYALLDTYAIDPRTGAGRYIGADLPPVGGIVGSRMLTYVDEPFPQLTLFRLR